MAQIEVDNKYAFTCTNNTWNTNLGIRRGWFFLHVQICIALFYQGYEKRTLSELFGDGVCESSLFTGNLEQSVYMYWLGYIKSTSKDLLHENNWTGA